MQVHKGGPPLMCGEHNVRATAGDKTGQNTDNGHTPSPRREIKIPDPAGIRTRAPDSEGKHSTDHPTATKNCDIKTLKCSIYIRC